ncbi:hypothetical protein B0H14DRAFT_3649425 [Mycena olivaceomarginata]|nr:hypothetical protein B0H14DRAFT_3873495 [Mycena olivaceomarginata]KAJ7854733.1 hypothetical protein B0H14DRAFT_3649425 [Mycena olivaceomarginata]
MASPRRGLLVLPMSENGADTSDSGSNGLTTRLRRFGGLCPIQIDCVLGSPPRYRILDKLGHGAFSTVWLALDHVAKINVALKIVAAEKTSDSRELSILRVQRLKATDAEEPDLAARHTALEIAFAQIALNDPDAPWDRRSDIWTLAICIYGLVNLTDLFSPFMSGPALHDTMYYCGDIPDDWCE